MNHQSLLKRNDYSDAYILETGDIMVTDNGAVTDVGFKNSEPFIESTPQKNNKHADFIL